MHVLLSNVKALNNSKKHKNKILKSLFSSLAFQILDINYNIQKNLFLWVLHNILFFRFYVVYEDCHLTSLRAY